MIAIAIAAPQAIATIDFLENLSNAKVLAAQQHKPIVLQFGATWCGWCRKMESQTFIDKRVEAEAANFLWVKIDIDAKPDLAAAYHVRGVPHSVVIDAKGRTLAEHVGFMAVDDFLAFLKTGLNAQAQQQIEGADGEGNEKPIDLNQAVTTLVEGLSKSERGGRDQILEAISKSGPLAWPALEKLMADPRLAIRAAAAGALIKATHAGIAFDPFADQAQRHKQLALWHEWIQQHPPPPAPSVTQPLKEETPVPSDQPPAGNGADDRSQPGPRTAPAESAR